MQAFAKKEVVLSAGSFESPKLLMLSGIGRQDELAEHGITSIKHLPGMGKSFQDHAAIFLTAQTKPGFTTRVAFESDVEAVKTATEQWNEDGTGEFATQFQSPPFMFNKLPEIYEIPEFKDLPIDMQEYLRRDTVPTYEAAFHGPKFPSFVQLPEGSEYFGLTVFGMNPQGSGTVQLASSNANDKAVIDPRILTHPFDRRVMIDSLISVMKFYKSTEFYRKYFVKWLSGPESESREDVERFLEEQTIVAWHANGTAKMGRKGDEERGACVDSNFKIMGMENLRVADMSVSPVTIN
jgi:choline dehydrogenase-like flavoprotein